MFSCQILVFSEKSKLSVVTVVGDKSWQKAMKAQEGPGRLVDCRARIQEVVSRIVGSM